MPQDLFRITAGALLRLLLSEGVVPWLVRALGKTTRLSPNATQWAIVQVRRSRSSSACQYLNIMLFAGKLFAIVPI